jgi:hypothetical protein
VYDFVDDGSKSYIVYELIDGRTLREEVSRAALDQVEVIEIGAQIADALSAAHTQGLIHRDIKPENIMLVTGDDRRVKILDFGLAKHFGAGLGQTLTETASMLPSGTLTYMAPEQLECLPTDPRCDIYATGLVLYEMCTGRNPWVRSSAAATISAILSEEVPNVRTVNPGLSLNLESVLMRCLRRRPEERYQSARDLALALRAIQNPTSPDVMGKQEESSMFASFFSLFGRTPYRRWEMVHVRMFVWALLLGSLGWVFVARAANRWDWTMFLAEIACIAALLAILGYLLYAGSSNRAELPKVVHKFDLRIRILIVSLVILAWMMAIRLLGTHPGWASFIALCGTAGGIKYLLFKSSSDRGAFPEP